MDGIGGYFSLELPQREEYHKDAIRLNTGRNCLEYILRVRKYHKVYIPYYTCDAVLEPFKKTETPYEFYHVDIHLEISDTITIKENEALLYTNYYGLKQRYLEQLAEKFGSSLIVDNTQAFYAKPLGGIDTFYTCRKFFGVPDGAYLYCNVELEERLEQDYSFDRLSHLLKRIDFSAEAGYADFRLADERLENQPIRMMSKLTQRMMQGIDYEAAAQRRRDNYQILDLALNKDNNIVFTLEDDAVPMVYPYLDSENGLREKLIGNKIFVARYWPNVQNWLNPHEIECVLALHMQPLPIDQRYNNEEMDFMVGVILND